MNSTDTTDDIYQDAITPSHARRILRSAKENGDSISDLLLWTCKVVIATNAPLRQQDARDVYVDGGGTMAFDADGWLTV